MTLFHWTFEGQSNTGVPSVANSDDFGDPAWSTANPSTLVTYSTAQAVRGTVSLLVNASTASVNLDKSDTANASAAFASDIYLTAYPSIDIQGPYGGRGSATAQTHIRITSTGQVRNVILATVGTASTGTMSLNTWYRVETVFAGFGTGSASATTNVYLSGTNTLVFAVPTVSGVAGTTALDLGRWTKFGGTSTVTFHIDDCRQDIGRSTELGPVAVPVAVSVICSVGLAGTDQAAHVLTATGRAAAGVAAVDTARKTATTMARAAAGVAPVGTARKTVTAVGRAAVGATATGTARKLSVVSGRAAAGFAASGSLVAVIVRAVTARASAGFTTRATARKSTPVAGRAAAGVSTTISPGKRVTALARAAVGVWAYRNAVSRVRGTLGTAARPGASLAGKHRPSGSVTPTERKSP